MPAGTGALMENTEFASVVVVVMVKG